jgi:hypothetical protein
MILLANLLQFFVKMLHTRCAKCNINFTVFALLVVQYLHLITNPVVAGDHQIVP